MRPYGRVKFNLQLINWSTIFLHTDTFRKVCSFEVEKEYFKIKCKDKHWLSYNFSFVGILCRMASIQVWLLTLFLKGPLGFLLNLKMNHSPVSLHNNAMLATRPQSCRVTSSTQDWTSASWSHHRWEDECGERFCFTPEGSQCSWHGCRYVQLLSVLACRQKGSYMLKWEPNCHQLHIFFK